MIVYALHRTHYGVPHLCSRSSYCQGYTEKSSCSSPFRPKRKLSIACPIIAHLMPCSAGSTAPAVSYILVLGFFPDFFEYIFITRFEGGNEMIIM